MQFTILFLLLFHFRSFYRRIRDPLGGAARAGFRLFLVTPFFFVPPKLWWLLLYTPVYCINFISCYMPVCAAVARRQEKGRQTSQSV